MAKNMDDLPTGGDKRRWSDGVNAFKFKPKDWHRVRFFGLTYTDFKHNIKTKSNKFFPAFCHGYDSENDQFFPDREERCPCCALGIAGSMRYFMNLIDLEIEDNKPQNARPDWSPVFMLEVSKTLFEKLMNLKSLNKGQPINKAKEGAIVNISYNKDADPASQYAASMEERCVPLTEDQLSYSVVQTINGQKKVMKPKDGLPGSFVYERQLLTLDDLKRSLKTHGYYDAAEEGEEEEGEDDDSDDEAVSSKALGDKPMPTSLKKGKSKVEEDEDELPPPPKKKAAPAPVEEDEDEEEAPPPPKKKAAPAPVEEDEDEEEAPPPPKKKAAPAPVEEEEDDDDDEEEDDEEEEATPPPKKKAAPVEEDAAPVTKAKGKAPANCPASFGAFANAHVCFTSCPVKKDCRDASAKKKAKKVDDDDV